MNFIPHQKNIDIESKWQDWLKKEVAIAFTVGSFVALFFTRFINPVNQDIALIKKDINTINNNHLSHMQTALEAIKDLDKEQTELQKKLHELEVQIAKNQETIQTALNLLNNKYDYASSNR